MLRSTSKNSDQIYYSLPFNIYGLSYWSIICGEIDVSLKEQFLALNQIW
jgi:hypothetical protein